MFGEEDNSPSASGDCCDAYIRKKAGRNEVRDFKKEFTFCQNQLHQPPHHEAMVKQLSQKQSLLQNTMESLKTQATTEERQAHHEMMTKIATNSNNCLKIFRSKRRGSWTSLVNLTDLYSTPSSPPRHAWTPWSVVCSWTYLSDLYSTPSSPPRHAWTPWSVVCSWTYLTDLYFTPSSPPRHVWTPWSVVCSWISLVNLTHLQLYAAVEQGSLSSVISSTQTLVILTPAISTTEY